MHNFAKEFGTPCNNVINFSNKSRDYMKFSLLGLDQKSNRTENNRVTVFIFIHIQFPNIHSSTYI